MRKSGVRNINFQKKTKKAGSRRIILLWIILLFVFFVFVYRTYDLQINQAEEFSQYFDSIRLKREVIPAYRGNIYDRNGTILAYTKVNRYINLSESIKGIYGAARESLIEDISKLTGISELNITDAINRNEDILIRPDISVNNPNISLKYDFERIYPFAGSLSHIIGYVNRDLTGVAGVEKTFNDYLKGLNGVTQVEVDSRTRQLKKHTIRKPQKGQDIYLSVDLKLQQYIEGLLTDIENPSVVIVSSPNSGEVLSMVSTPFYESSRMTKPIIEEEWQLMLKNEGNIFLNRAISSTYNPGSLIKPFMALSVLSDNNSSVYEAVTQRLYCDGEFSLYSNDGKTEYKYRDWLSTGHGTVTLFDAIKESCNVYFYNKGLELGIDFLKSMSDTIGLTMKSQINLPEEKTGTYPSNSWKLQEIGENWYLGDTVLSSIGQGYVRLTPIEMLKLFEVIALEGNKQKSYITANPFSMPNRYLNLPKSHWIYLKMAMNAVISQPGGTAYSAFNDANYKNQMAGKTGTAEIGIEDQYHAYFAAFYPLDQPQYSVFVLLENGGYGGQNAAPIGRKIFDYIINKESESF